MSTPEGSMPRRRYVHNQDVPFHYQRDIYGHDPRPSFGGNHPMRKRDEPGVHDVGFDVEETATPYYSSTFHPSYTPIVPGNLENVLRRRHYGHHDFPSTSTDTSSEFGLGSGYIQEENKTQSVLTWTNDVGMDTLKRLKPVVPVFLSVGIKFLTVMAFLLSMTALTTYTLDHVYFTLTRQILPGCNWPIISMMSHCKDGNSNGTTSTTTPTSICTWPIISTFPACTSAKGNGTESNSSSIFENLVDTQEKMEPLVEKSGWGIHFALTMAKSETALRDLSDSVDLSSLPSKDVIGREMDSLIHSANDFVELSMKIDPAIAGTRNAMQDANGAGTKILQTIEKQGQPNSFIWSLLSRGPTPISEDDIESFNVGLSNMVEEINALEVITVATSSKLAEMEKYSRAINRAVQKEDKALADEQETLVALWRKTAQQKSKLKAYASNQELLSELSSFRKSAAQEINQIKVIVGELSETVKRLRQNAGKAIDATTLNEEGKLNGGRIRVWIENLQRSTDNFKLVTERGRQTNHRIIDREVNGQRDLGLPQ
ncbi:hypothetical protein CPB86DRAFT_812672 [Serendipita vermifera]|nr:hypothetical protein CPB86DRAFT_812672 [Serendipita vermifera]